MLIRNVMENRAMVASKQTERIIAFLNELLELDPCAVTAVMTSRAPCNQQLQSHPTVQVGKFAGRVEVSALGILNGLCGVFEDGPFKNRGPISAITKDGRIVRFERTDAPALPGKGLQRIGVTV
jgi:hypothetical protein